MRLLGLDLGGRQIRNALALSSRRRNSGPARRRGHGTRTQTKVYRIGALLVGNADVESLANG
jgi:hypothetical protein